MPFNLIKFFEDVFDPQRGEVVTIMYDLPHGEIKDTPGWKERREMAEEWREKLVSNERQWGITVNATLKYQATALHSGDLPPGGTMSGSPVNLQTVLNESTIILSMPQFSASGPLVKCVLNSKKLRVGSMPMAQRFMEETGLSADYKKIARTCDSLIPLMQKAMGADVEFSTGHRCYFDFSNHNEVQRDDGILHPMYAGMRRGFSNLPAGEVFIAPNENEDSRTEGELPEMIEGKVTVYVVKKNKIVEVKGEGSGVRKMGDYFAVDPARCNIAECSIGLNDKATVTGNLLQDEKAGFHWAYGRSDHVGGKTGVKDFKDPKNVVHWDTVYSKNSPIICKKFDFVYPDNTRKTMIVNGVLEL